MTDVSTTYEAHRPKLLAIAYRMLGELGSAEDAVQEAFLRMHREIGREGSQTIASPEAYLVTLVSRICIDELRSARARRERYVGEWLPEPLIGDESDDPAARAEIAESLALSFLVVLEQLSPEQRAAFLLRDVFDYPYARIAEILHKSVPAVRQIAVRARRHVEERKPRFETTTTQHERLADRFFAAVEEGDLSGLESLLAGDVELHGDGGGKVPALARFLRGRSRVARTLVNWGRAGRRMPGIRLERRSVNGRPGAVLLDRAGQAFNVIELEFIEGEISSISSIVNPDKLVHIGPVGDLGVMMREANPAD